MKDAAVLRDLFAEKKITSVVVIDDCFDPLSSRLAAEVEEFAEAVVDDEEWRRSIWPWLSASGLEGVPENVDDAAVDRITWSASVVDYLDSLSSIEQDDLPTPLLKLWRREVKQKEGERGPGHLASFLNSLHSAGVEVHKLQSEIQGVDAITQPVIFLDYVFGDASDGRTAGEWVRKIMSVRSVSSASAPIIVLMSSSPDIDYDRFCADNEVPRGAYYFAPKTELNDDFLREQWLRRLAHAHGSIQAFFDFLGTLEAQAEAVITAFVGDLRALKPTDFHYMQLLSLEEEGQPLGDYLAWLFESSLAARLLATTRPHKQRLSVADFSYEPLSILSDGLAKFYVDAFFEVGVGDVGPHPRMPDQHDKLCLQQGDIFHKKESLVVWLVVTPSCDLAFGGRRQFKPLNKVYLLEGQLKEHHPLNGVADVGVDPLIQISGSYYSVDWSTSKGMRTVDLGKFAATKSQEQLVRVARMREPHLASRVRAVAADLSRSGHPVPPPTQTPLEVVISSLNEESDPWVAHDYPVALLRGRLLVIQLTQATLAEARKRLISWADREKDEAKKVKWTEQASDPSAWAEAGRPSARKPGKIQPLTDALSKVGVAFNCPSPTDQDRRKYAVIITLSNRSTSDD